MTLSVVTSGAEVVIVGVRTEGDERSFGVGGRNASCDELVSMINVRFKENRHQRQATAGRCFNERGCPVSATDRREGSMISRILTDGLIETSGHKSW